MQGDLHTPSPMRPCALRSKVKTRKPVMVATVTGAVVAPVRREYQVRNVKNINPAAVCLISLFKLSLTLSLAHSHETNHNMNN